MYRILLVGDDLAEANGISEFLLAAGYRVADARSGHDAIVASRTLQPDVVLINVLLSDMSGMDLLREVRRAIQGSACIMISASVSSSALIESMRCGACDWLQKPICKEDLLEAIRRAVVVRSEALGPGLHLPTSKRHAHMRLAYKAVEFIKSPNDTPTLREFARAIGVSAGGFRNWCRTAGVRARGYMHLARALRAVYRRERNPAESLENLLEIVDKRTLAKFAVASGGTRTRMPLTVDELLRAQRLVDPQAAAAIRGALANATRGPHRDVSGNSRESTIIGKAFDQPHRLSRVDHHSHAGSKVEH